MATKLLTAGVSLLAVGAMFAAACGGAAGTSGSKTDTGATGKTETKAAAPATAPAAAGSPAAPKAAAKEAPAVGSVGVTDTEIKIGTWLAQSGPAASYITIGQGWESVFKKVNDAGGINGRKINHIWLDDQYDVAKTPGVVKQLAEQEKVFAFSGGGGTPNNLAVMDYILGQGIPNLFPTTGSGRWANPLKKSWFALATNYVDDGNLLAEYAVNDLKAKKIAIVFQNDAFGQEGAEGFKAYFAKNNITPAVEVPTQPQDTDMSSAVLRLKQAAPDVVLLYMIARPAALLMKEAEKQGLKTQIVGSYVLADPSTVELAGTAAEGAIFGAWLPLPDKDDPGVKTYKETVQKYYPQIVIGSNSMWGYTNAQLTVEALKRMGPTVTREKLIETLEGMQNVDLDLVKGVSYSPTSHQGYATIALVQVKNGKFVEIAPPRTAKK